MDKRFAMLAMALHLLAPQAAAVQEMDFAISPQHIEIGTQYSGMKLKATGYVPADGEVVVLLQSAAHDLHVKQKDKVFGLWMNVHDVTFTNVPNIYMLESSRPLGQFADYQALNRLGYQHIKKHIFVETSNPEADKALLLDELYKLKHAEGLYNEDFSGVYYGPIEGDAKPFTAQLSLPSSGLSAGKLAIQAFTIQNGQIIAQGSKEISVSLAGLPALLSNLAFQHSLVYGIVAALLAMVVGLGIGSLFRGQVSH